VHSFSLTVQTFQRWMSVA